MIFETWFRRSPPPPSDRTIEGALLTEVGCGRTTNQDNVAYAAVACGPPSRPEIAVVADGMGGHAAGEEASAIAAATILQTVCMGDGRIGRRLARAFKSAHGEIRSRAGTSPALAGMGTTCTALVFDADGLWLGHVGDSRAYLLREDRMRQLSEDHSLVADAVRRGRMSEEEARGSAERHVILQALGHGWRVRPQIWSAPMQLQDRDQLLLCSDGLSGIVDDATMQATLMRSDSAARACQALVDAALAADGSADNISVGVFRVGRTRGPADTGAMR